MPRAGNPTQVFLVPEYYDRLKRLAEWAVRPESWVLRALAMEGLDRVIPPGSFEVNRGAFEGVMDAAGREQKARDLAIASKRTFVKKHPVLTYNVEAISAAMDRFAALHGIDDEAAPGVIAKKAGVHRTLFNRVLSRKTTTARYGSAERLASVLGVRIEDLFVVEEG